VAFDTADASMHAAAIGRELRLHDVATLAAELVCLHVCDGAVCDLARDDDVHDGHRDEEKCQTAQHDAAALGDGETLPDATPGQPGADGYQNQSGEEYGRDGEEDQDSNVWVGGSPASVHHDEEQQ